MATAMRTMATKLKQKFPVAVQRLFASPPPPPPPPGVHHALLLYFLLGIFLFSSVPRQPCACSASRLDFPAFRRLDEHLDKIHKKNCRNDYLSCIVGMSLGGLLFQVGVKRL